MEKKNNLNKKMKNYNKENIIKFSKDYVENLKNLLDNINLSNIEECFEILELARKNKNNIFIIGNGGSASTASHIGNDFGLAALKISKLKKSDPYRVISLTDNNSVITALGNDCGFENIFIEQLKILFNPGDVLLVISASGNSKNIINACDWVNSNSGKTIGWLGFDGGNLLKKVSCAILVETPKGEYAPVEDVHLIFNHILVSWMHIYLAKPD
tara:strand:- start:518 stop:1159 length:642 start_codon:yes stop_codon:yes gene_type:complete